MGQKITITKIEKKFPRNGGNPFWVVYGSEDEEMTTFDAKFNDYAPGTVIDAEIKLGKGGKVNIVNHTIAKIVIADHSESQPTGNYASPNQGHLPPTSQVNTPQADSTIYLRAAVVSATGRIVASLIDAKIPLVEWDSYLNKTAQIISADTLINAFMSKAKHELQTPTTFKTPYDFINYYLLQGWQYGRILEVLSINNPQDIKDFAGAAKILDSATKTPR
jgi:hypothetical protein